MTAILPPVWPPPPLVALLPLLVPLPEPERPVLSGLWGYAMELLRIIPPFCILRSYLV